jgi:predicted DNA-binding transcriptional regulator YafY
MPANKNAMTRYKILDELLSSPYHDYSLDELTDEVSNRLCSLYPDSDGVVRRTIEKDISYLEREGPFLVDIKRYTVSTFNWDKQKNVEKHCLRYEKPGFSIFKKDMTDDEKHLLSEALSLLGQFDGLPNLDALENFRLGLGVRESHKIISFTKNPLENSNLLGEIFTAISQKQVIEIIYHKFGNSADELKINLHPYLLKEYNNRWFLLAATEVEEKLLCFGLERIGKITPLPSHKYLEYKGNLDEYFEDIIGVTNYANAKVEHIEFWVSDISKDYVATKPLHDSQKHYHGEAEQQFRLKYPSLSSGSFFSIDCKENYELIRELSSFGENLLVLSPRNIQDKVYHSITQMAEKYKSLRKA